MDNSRKIFLRQIITYNAKHIAEIGINNAKRAQYIINNCNLKKYYLIDPDIDNIFPTSYFTKFPCASFLKMNSKTASNLIEDNSLDIVMINDKPDYISTTKDIELWLPKIKVTGIMMGSNYMKDNSPSSVKRAVEQKFKRFHTELTDGLKGLYIWWASTDEYNTDMS